MIRMRVAHLGLDRATNTPVVILREEEGERTLPIWIGASEANAIALELQGVKPKRPIYVQKDPEWRSLTSRN